MALRSSRQQHHWRWLPGSLVSIQDIHSCIYRQTTLLGSAYILLRTNLGAISLVNHRPWPPHILLFSVPGAPCRCEQAHMHLSFPAALVYLSPHQCTLLSICRIAPSQIPQLSLPCFLISNPLDFPRDVAFRQCV